MKCEYLPAAMGGTLTMNVKFKIKLLQKIYSELNKPFILGLSGGIDSCVCAYLLEEAKVPYGMFFIGIESSEKSFNDAKLIAESLNTTLNAIDLLPIYNIFFKYNSNCTFKYLDKKNIPDIEIGKMNLKARLRMIYQYYITNLYGGLVVGTENKSERYMGYATKYGDSACDIEPILDLCKAEVYYAANILNCPKQIINKEPSADLYDGQTDENEMGVSYKQLDEYLIHGSEKSYLSKEIIGEIENRHKKNLHKFEMQFPFIFKS
ncbi:NAD(+) synthase [Candidatus Pacearchaeota archaeon]|jgi:NAD+ synthase|nr:NAD(+) synthase [bacterium]MCK9597047.1 NAD(+) synthase [Candidatus Pacearchaeota archaeon]